MSDAQNVTLLLNLSAMEDVVVLGEKSHSGYEM